MFFEIFANVKRRRQLTQRMRARSIGRDTDVGLSPRSVGSAMCPAAKQPPGDPARVLGPPLKQALGTSLNEVLLSPLRVLPSYVVDTCEPATSE